MNIAITGTGSCIPDLTQKNEDFLSHSFLNSDGSKIPQNNAIIIKKFKAITGIEERRYAKPGTNTSDLAFYAAKKAIADANINPETLDYIIVANNYGDLTHLGAQSDSVPSLAARVKHKLQIKNPNCIAYDLMFGCPGWVQAVIHANAFIKSGIAKKCLIIGAETLSRVVDKNDRDAMIYADGAGAAILEETTEKNGIISHKSVSHTLEESNYIHFGKSYDNNCNSDTRYIKMYGRKIYEFALNQVPMAMKTCLNDANINITDLKKIFIHQANEKMDEAILERFYKLYDSTPPENCMPMSIQFLGNSSVATVPTLFDLVKNDKIDNQKLYKGDYIMFASVGAGMHINAIIYKY